MDRITRVLDNTLAILRTALAEQIEGGAFHYNWNNSLPPLMTDQQPIGSPLKWDNLLIGPEALDSLDSGRTSGELDEDGNPLPDTRDLVGITVLAEIDRVRNYELSRGSFPATEIELRIIIWASLKDERWDTRLQNYMASYIGEVLWANKKLTHNGQDAAEALNYVSTEVVTDAEPEALIPTGTTVQSWLVVAKSNTSIGFE